MLSGIISGRGQGDGTLKVIQEESKIAAPRQDIFPGVEGVSHPWAAVTARELHEPP